MKRLAFLFVASVASLAHAQSMPIDTALARRYFDEVRTLGAADGKALWGTRVDGPMLFVDRQSRTVVANQPDGPGTLKRYGSVWVGVLPKELNPANTAVDFGGQQWSMVMWPVPDNRYARGRLLMHEQFHRIQKSLGMSAGNPSNAHLATADGRIWTRLEWRALTEALLRTGDDRKRALSDALIFRARRYSLAPQAAEDERQLELNEGLAEYTGFVLGGLPRSVLADRVAVQLAQYEQQDSFIRSFAYASGPAYALSLDVAGKSWRSRLNKSASLSTLAANAFGIRNIVADSAESRVGRYGGQRMIEDERAREANRLANEARLRTRFVDGVTLRLPVGAAFSFSFDPNGATILPGFGTVYESSRITDEWGVLEVSAGGVLFLRRDDGAMTGVVVANPAVSGREIHGDGWTLQIAAGWSVKELSSRKGSFILSKDGGGEH